MNKPSLFEDQFKVLRLLEPFKGTSRVEWSRREKTERSPAGLRRKAIGLPFCERSVHQSPSFGSRPKRATSAPRPLKTSSTERSNSFSSSVDSAITHRFDVQRSH